MFESENFALKEQFNSLARLCESLGHKKTLQSALQPMSADNFALSVMELLVGVTEWAQEKYPEFHHPDWQEAQLKKRVLSGVPNPRVGVVEKTQDAL